MSRNHGHEALADGEVPTRSGRSIAARSFPMFRTSDGPSQGDGRPAPSCGIGDQETAFIRYIRGEGGACIESRLRLASRSSHSRESRIARRCPEVSGFPVALFTLKFGAPAHPESPRCAGSAVFPGGFRKLCAQYIMLWMHNIRLRKYPASLLTTKTPRIRRASDSAAMGESSNVATPPAPQSVVPNLSRS